MVSTCSPVNVKTAEGIPCLKPGISAGRKNVLQTISRWWGLLFLVVAGATIARAEDAPPIPRHVVAIGRQLRVDLTWEADAKPFAYEVRRARSSNGPFEALPLEITNANVNVYSDFIGPAGGGNYYQVRSVRLPGTAGPRAESGWSAICEAQAKPFNEKELPAETEEAGFRYFYNYSHPGSGLARMGTESTPNVCVSGGTGFGMYNLVVGVERGFISRQQAQEQALRELKFLATKATRYHGAFPHMLDGITGETIPFTDTDDGADIVETSLLMEGALLWREYFSGNDPREQEIRKLADGLWRSVDWRWFMGTDGGKAYLRWHWSPKRGWDERDRVIGFNEAQLAYVLALASPTHPIPAQAYWQGWQPDYYGRSRTRFGVWLQLSQEDLGPPLFWIEYSYLGLDPRQISYRGRTYLKEFEDICKVAQLYADSRSNQFKGYGELWGWTAGYGPNGYKVYEPGTNVTGRLIQRPPFPRCPMRPGMRDRSWRRCIYSMGANFGGPSVFTMALTSPGFGAPINIWRMTWARSPP